VQPVAASAHVDTTPSQPVCAGPSGMCLSVYFGKRLHGMLLWTHVHV